MRAVIKLRKSNLNDTMILGRSSEDRQLVAQMENEVMQNANYNANITPKKELKTEKPFIPSPTPTPATKSAKPATPKAAPRKREVSPVEDPLLPRATRSHTENNTETATRSTRNTPTALKSAPASRRSARSDPLMSPPPPPRGRKRTRDSGDGLKSGGREMVVVIQEYERRSADRAQRKLNKSPPNKRGRGRYYEDIPQPAPKRAKPAPPKAEPASVSSFGRVRSKTKRSSDHIYDEDEPEDEDDKSLKPKSSNRPGPKSKKETANRRKSEPARPSR